ncbi:hypothetical protein A2cp1_1102 [Anaeromyxobacter dehalogenans 2CP-1]|uniref:Uncharacterized protein n=2 Tax=Anaeromyxobacter dehalogenans TaxID=161493 RepID=B8JF93_ANAD2|nr:hypothetical protein A2cp1_1102 [Anaeromyxobacter dehalogenans 2CP-1]
MTRLVTSLAAHVDVTDPECPYRAALEKIARHATTKCADFTNPPQAFIDQLCPHYSKVLEEDVHLAAGDRSLVFDVLDLPRMYSEPAVLPDAEHRFIALLVMEGVVPRILTTNWDGLIEAAYRDAQDGHAPPLPVVISPADLDGVEPGPRLVKFHGCAVRAAKHPDAKQHFVATQKRINEWNMSEQFLAIRDEVRTAVRYFPALLVGLSAQDVNIQMQFEQAVVGREPWATWAPSRAAFAQAEAGEAQERILKTLYGKHYAGANAGQIERAATIGLYAKPLFGALYFELVFRKLLAICDAGQEAFTPEQLQFVRAWLLNTQNRIRDHYDRLPPSERWVRLSECLPSHIAHAHGLYRHYRPISRETAYVPVSRIQLGHPQGAPEDARALLCLAALSHGDTLGAWSAEPPRPGSDAFHAFLKIGLRQWRIVVVRDSLLAMHRLEASMLSAHAAETVAVYPTGSRPRKRRRGLGATLPSRGRSAGPYEVWFDEIASEPYTPAQMVEELKLELLGLPHAP